MTPEQIALLIVAGFLAGVCNAVAGGGTLLTFPALLSVGLPPVTANVTNTIAVWPGYLGGVAAFRDRLRERERRGLIVRLVAAGALGGIAGAVLLLALPEAVFGAVVPYLVLAATALFAAQPRLTRLLKKRLEGSEHGISGLPLTVGIFLAGLYGAYFGGGLGIVLLAVLMLCVDAGVQYLNGVKILLSLVVNTVALLGFVAFGPVHWAAVAIIAPACLAGGWAGGRLSRRLPPAVLRAVVTVFGLAIGVRLLVAPF